jgi:hypothetical protein
LGCGNNNQPVFGLSVTVKNFGLELGICDHCVPAYVVRLGGRVLGRKELRYALLKAGIGLADLMTSLAQYIGCYSLFSDLGKSSAVVM